MALTDRPQSLRRESVSNPKRSANDINDSFLLGLPLIITLSRKSGLSWCGPADPGQRAK